MDHCGANIPIDASAKPLITINAQAEKMPAQEKS